MIVLDPPCPVCPGRPRHGRGDRDPIVALAAAAGLELLPWQVELTRLYLVGANTGVRPAFYRGRRGGVSTVRDLVARELAS